MAKFYRSVLICAVLFSLVGCAKRDTAERERSPAEKLTMVLPDDVLGFVATSGGEYLKPAFEKSILGRMWNDAGVQSFYQSIKKEVLAKVEQEMEDPNARKVPDIVIEFAKLAVDRPIVAGAAQKEATNSPPVYGFAILDGGTHKAEIASAIGKLEALADFEIIEINVGSFKMHGPKDTDDVPGYWGWVGNYFVLAINEGEGLAIRHISKPRKVLPGYLEKVSGTDDALAVYVDCQKIAGLVSAVAEEEGATNELDAIRTVMKELGLNNVKTITARAGFAGADVVCNELVEVPEPRTGVLASFKPISLRMFDMVDAGAVNAAAVNCDVGGIYDTIMRAIKAAAPSGVYAEIEEAIEGFESGAQVKIRGGLLGSLAGPMVFYSLPAGVLMDVPSGGIAAIAKLKDAPTLEKTMVALRQFAAAASEGMLQVSSQVQNDGRTYHSWVIAPLAMMQILPCWTIVDEHIVIASNVTLCNAAVKQVSSAGSGRKSVRTTEGFKKATAKLPDNLVFLSYTDSKVQFNQIMVALQRFWPMITMFAGKAGISLPVMLPSLGDIAKDMGPCCKCCWFDAEGLRLHCRGPGFDAGAVAAVPIGAAVLMPALARTRQLAQRVVSGTNLSGIGKACAVYANDDEEGRYPPNLQKLVELEYCSAKQLESPLKPRRFDGPSYIYVAGQTAAMDPGNVVAYENPAFCREGLNVLFLDTHVKWMKPADFLKELEATYKRLGREMPEIKFKGSGRGGPLKLPRSPGGGGSSDKDPEDEVKRSALRKAVEEGDLEKVKTLIADGADVNAKYNKGETALYLAIQSGRVEIARLLIEKGADINAKGGRWFTPLHLAARFGHTEVGELLIAKGANVNAKGQGDWTALLLAARFGNTDMAKLLIAKGADMYAETNQAMTPLLFSVLHNCPDIEKLLLSKGAQLSVFSESMRGDAEHVAAFLERDPNVVSVTRAEFTPLHWAAYCGHVEVAKLLLAKGADVDANSKYVTPLHWAVRYNHLDMIRLLIAEGADVNAKDRHGSTLLHYAATTDAAELLIYKGADVNAKDKRGATPLHYVVSKSGHRRVLKLLIPFSADISGKHTHSLHAKAEQVQKAVAEVLIAKGADVNVKDEKGRTALDIASRMRYKALAELLRKYEAEEDAG